MPETHTVTDDKGGRFAALLFAAAWTAAGLATLAMLLLWGYAFTPPPAVVNSPVQVYIPAGVGLVGIRKALAESGMIADDRRFEALAAVMGVAGRLRSGEYQFQGTETPYQLIRELEKGRLVLRTVTIPEGADLEAVAAILAEERLADPEAFLRYVRDPKVVQAFGGRGESLEGYLFPETYRFVRGSSLREIVAAMVKMSDRVWEELTASAGHADRHRVLTLAAIVEKESGLAAERPLIARVFLERLRLGMKLQADPTVAYGLKIGKRPLTRTDLATAHPYNTYQIDGLPPGPICNPGRDAIAAVLQPADEAFLYFVSNNDGSHRFSKNLADHNRAVQQYRNGRRKE
ncbi:MAG: endolytic transglycosylase MltG [Thermodesulfobacteriota bacterium]